MKSDKPIKPIKLPKVDLAGLASGIHAAVALSQASGEPIPPTLARKFSALLEAELDAIVPETE